MRLYDFENTLEKNTRLRYKITFKEKVLYSSEDFTDSVNSSMRQSVYLPLEDEEITEDQNLEITFSGVISKKALNPKEAQSQPKKVEESLEEEKVVGKLSMPVSQLIRRSILNQEFRGALKIMKIEENILDSTTKINDNDVEDAENQFIYNEYLNSTNNITELFLQEMHGNLLGFAIISITLRLRKNLAVLIQLKTRNPTQRNDGSRNL